MKKLVVLAMVAVAITIFYGCQKDELVGQLADEQPQAVLKTDVYGINGFLVFRNSKILSQTLNSLENMSEEERRNWEKKNFFVSQLTIFNNIVDAEIQLDAPYENMSAEELKNVKQPPLHSEVYYKFLNKGIIREYTESDGTELYDYSTCAPYLSAILDENGIFVVGDTMFQYTASAIKKWIGCDINNNKKLINSNESIGQIEVKMLLKSSTIKYGNWAYDSGNDRRIRIGINFNSYQYYADGTVWNYEHWVEVQSQKKNFWGNWKYNWTTMSVLGHWDYTILYENQPLQTGEFRNTAGYHEYPNPQIIYASNLKSSCSISTGTIYPFNSTMSIGTDGIRDTGPFMSEDLKVIYDVFLTNYYWEVIGHAYVKATVTP